MIEKTGRGKESVNKSITNCVKKGWIEVRDKDGNILKTPRERSGKKLYYRLGMIFINKITSPKSGQDENQPKKQTKPAQKVDQNQPTFTACTKEILTKEILTKERRGEFKKVLLTKEELNKLVNKIGERNTTILITELDGYIESLGKKGENKYSSHYAVILNWARRRVFDFQSKLKVKTKEFII